MNGLSSFYTYAYGLYQVGFSHAGRSEYEERIEGLALGVVGYCLADRACNLVADAAAVVLEGIAWIELRIKRLKSLWFERVGGFCLGLSNDGGRRSRGADPDSSGGFIFHLMVEIKSE